MTRQRPQKKALEWPGLSTGGSKVRLENERIIGKVFGRHLLRAGHHFERIDLGRGRRGNTAWLSDTAHPATKDTIKAAVLTANNVLAI